MSTSEPDNPAVVPDTGIPLGAADGEGEAADPADLGPTGDSADDDDAFFQAPEPPAEDSAMSVREQDEALGGPGDVVDG